MGVMPHVPGESICFFQKATYGRRNGSKDRDLDTNGRVSAGVMAEQVLLSHRSDWRLRSAPESRDIAARPTFFGPQTENQTACQVVRTLFLSTGEVKFKEPWLL